ncbi:hypothetical protein CN689_22380 [Peribacillus butanolivorans]|uniref:Uncharacterized protein n=1 Tax=Peribacillus butanolivorans TaxID=421767 RepID=A0AAX0RQS4_9BACI|nr:hypothetical protein [Peribacillus butanolivorans]PEJ28305.1 hypothetical protein CN689_22380 [Peribacillus butanolivorans]
MKKKVLFVLCTMVISFIGAFFLETNKASANDPWKYFHTQDGKWDGTITTTRTNHQVFIQVDRDRLYYKPSSSAGAGQASYHNIAARLCSVSTGRCTEYSGFYLRGSVYNPRNVFSNMIPGTYRIDIRDYYNPGFVYGYVDYGTASGGMW